ncbi:hypothetical protein [Nocardia sp. NPDC003963]
MGDRVDYNDEAFRAAAHRTGGVRDRVDAVLDTLESRIGARGKPWGDDSLGTAFYEGDNDNGYRSGKKNLVASAENISGTMGSFHDGQVESADYLQDMEDGNRDGLR